MRTRQALIGASLALAACSPRVAQRQKTPAAQPVQARPSRPHRALLFRAAGFPTVDAPVLDDDVLERALAGLPISRAASVHELVASLTNDEVDVLVLPYGSAFPVDAWPRIQNFLAQGGGLANLGGAPFHVPVALRADAWSEGLRAPSFAHELLVAPAEPIAIASDWKLASGAAFGGTSTWALTPRLTREKAFPEEHEIGRASCRERV